MIRLIFFTFLVVFIVIPQNVHSIFLRPVGEIGAAVGNLECISDSTSTFDDYHLCAIRIYTNNLNPEPLQNIIIHEGIWYTNIFRQLITTRNCTGFNDSSDIGSGPCIPMPFETAQTMTLCICAENNCNENLNMCEQSIQATQNISILPTIMSTLTATIECDSLSNDSFTCAPRSDITGYINSSACDDYVRDHSVLCTIIENSSGEKIQSALIEENYQSYLTARLHSLQSAQLLEVPTQTNTNIYVKYNAVNVTEECACTQNSFCNSNITSCNQDLTQTETTNATEFPITFSADITSESIINVTMIIDSTTFVAATEDSSTTTAMVTDSSTTTTTVTTPESSATAAILTDSSTTTTTATTDSSAITSTLIDSSTTATTTTPESSATAAMMTDSSTTTTTATTESSATTGILIDSSTTTTTATTESSATIGVVTDSSTTTTATIPESSATTAITTDSSTTTTTATTESSTTAAIMTDSSTTTTTAVTESSTITIIATTDSSTTITTMTDSSTTSSTATTDSSTITATTSTTFSTVTTTTTSSSTNSNTTTGSTSTGSTASTTSSTVTNSVQEETGLSRGAIAGIVVGVTVPVIIVISLVFVACANSGPFQWPTDRTANYRV